MYSLDASGKVVSVVDQTVYMAEITYNSVNILLVGSNFEPAFIR